MHAIHQPSSETSPTPTHARESTAPLSPPPGVHRGNRAGHRAAVHSSLSSGSRVALALGLACLLAGVVWTVSPPATSVDAAPNQTEPVAWVYLPINLNRSLADPTPRPSPTDTPGPSPTSTASATASPSPTPSQTATNTATPEPTPTPTETPVPEPEWLQVVNDYRTRAGLPSVVENETFSAEAELHARYMVKTDQIGHSENRNSPWYTVEGERAARNGNVYASSRMNLPPRAPISTWMVGPFHEVGIIDPKLSASGYGAYSENIGNVHFGATLNVLEDRSRSLEDQAFPITYPADGETIPDLAYPGNESPDPLTGCPGYSAPTGPPLVVMLDKVPAVSSTRIESEGGTVPHCTFDETSYRHSNGNLQDLGRGVLRMRHAIILMPRSPLSPSATYDVTVVTNGDTVAWSFTAGSGTGAHAGLAQEGWIR